MNKEERIFKDLSIKCGADVMECINRTVSLFEEKNYQHAIVANVLIGLQYTLWGMLEEKHGDNTFAAMKDFMEVIELTHKRALQSILEEIASDEEKAKKLTSALGSALDIATH